MYRPKNPSYYHLRARDCETAAADRTLTTDERLLMLRCARRWHELADAHHAPDERVEHDGSGTAARSPSPAGISHR